VFDSIDEVLAGLHAQNYIADRALSTSVFLSLRLKNRFCWNARPGGED
jgi:hypothetical protein